MKIDKIRIEFLDEENSILSFEIVPTSFSISHKPYNILNFEVEGLSRDMEGLNNYGQKKAD